MIRSVAALAALVLIIVAFGARPSGAGADDPLRAARLTALARDQVAEADTALADVETALGQATGLARDGQAAILTGPDDPAVALSAAADGYESAADPVGRAQAALADLGWTLRALAPETEPPALDLQPDDVLDLSAQWRAAAPPSSALADTRRQCEATIDALNDALAALEANDPHAALGHVDRAEASLEIVRPVADDLSTLPYWVDTVGALLDATRGIADAALAGDEAALAEAQAAYEEAAVNAHRADQALTIALGEAAARITGPASASSAEAQRAVAATRDQLAALSILR